VSPKLFDTFFSIFSSKISKILQRFHQVTQQQQQQPAAASSQQQQPTATSSQQQQPAAASMGMAAAWLLHGHAAWACCMGMAAAWACCCFKTGMHGAWHAAASKPGCMVHGMSLQQQLRASMRARRCNKWVYRGPRTKTSYAGLFLGKPAVQSS
jgi:hypothetical protein